MSNLLFRAAVLLELLFLGKGPIIITYTIFWGALIIIVV